MKTKHKTKWETSIKARNIELQATIMLQPSRKIKPACLLLTVTLMIMLGITMVLALPVAAVAADTEILATNEPQYSGLLGDNLTWSYNSARKTLTIGGSGVMIDFSDAAPPWFKNFGSQIQTVVIENGVTSIGANAFSSCSSLSDVTIGDSVISIGDYTFAYCSSLSRITIPQSVSSLGDNVFNQCSSLTEIIVDEANQSFCSVGGVLFSKDKKSLLVYPAGNIVTSYAVPDGVITIENSAFNYCGKLMSIILPDGLTTVGNRAFAFCSNLSSITIADSVSSLGSSAFMYCSSLSGITIPDSVSSLGRSAFMYCSSLSGITIPDRVTSIDEYTFAYCRSLESVIMGDEVGNIGEYAFAYCSSLSSIIIPQKTSSLGYAAFYQCSSLDNVAIGDGVTAIEGYAFAGCSSLSSIMLPQEVSSLGESVFNECSSLTEINVAAANQNFSSVDGVVFSKDKKILLVYPVGKTAASYAVPDGVTVVESRAFAHCSNLTNIIIPDGVTGIGKFAFTGCSNLSSLTIADSVSSLGSSAFRSCSSLSSITIPGGVTSLASYLFNGCSSLSQIIIHDGVTSISDFTFFNCSSLESLIIPDGVTEIDKFAFAGCSSLSQVIMGRNVSSVGKRIFRDCPEMSAVYCYGAAPEVYAADSEDASFPTAATIYYIEGKDGWTEPTWQGYNTKSLTELAAPQVKAAAKVPAGQCKIFWKAVPGAQAYEIYRAASEQGAYYLVQTTKKVSYVDSAAALGDNYYKVAAIARDQENYASSCSEIVKCSCALAQPQVKGSNDAATGYCILSWQEIKGVTQYEIWRADSSRGKYVLQTAVAAGSGTENSISENSNQDIIYTDDQAAAGRSYCYKIKAIAADQQFGSADSRIIIRTCDLPQPLVYAAWNAKGQPSLSWEKVDGAVKYQVFRSTSADGHYKLIKITAKTAFVDSKADKTAQYYYKVKALAKRPVANSACSDAAEL